MIRFILYVYILPRNKNEANQAGLELNGTHELLVYADVYILGGGVHGIRKKNTL